MKTIIAFAAVAVASLGVAGVASAQDSGINVVSPFVGIEHVTVPYWDDNGTNTDTDDEWARFGDSDTNFTVVTAGTEVPVATLSGGNIDPLLLNRVLRTGLATSGRFLMVQVRLSDQPGSLAKLVNCVAEMGTNIIQTSHTRMNPALASEPG